MISSLNTPRHTAYDFTESYEKVQDYTIHVRENARAGNQAVILIHGIGVSEKYFRRFADKLARSYNVISVDLPGYGQSEKPNNILDLDQLADVLNAFIDGRSIKNPILIGQSMGCQIVTHFAVSYPDKAKKLILLSPTVNNKERSAFMQLLRLLQDTAREPFMGNVTVFREYLKFGIRRFIVTQHYMITDRPEKMLPLISIPLLILRGSKDRIVPRAWAQTLATTTKHALIQEISSAPHNFQWTHPGQSAKICDDFITES